VDAWVAADGLAAGSPGGVATLRVGLGNRGGAPALSTTLNKAITTVMVARQAYLPLIAK
jgi:hypothetical protein